MAANGGLQSIRGSRPARTAGNATRGGGNLIKAWKQAVNVKTRHRANFSASSGDLAEVATLPPEIDQGVVNAAYEAVLKHFSGAIAAAEAESSKTPEQRAAAVKALRLQQQQSGAAARRAAMDAEKARVKAARERQRPAAKPNGKPKGHSLA